MKAILAAVVTARLSASFFVIGRRYAKKKPEQKISRDFVRW